MSKQQVKAAAAKEAEKIFMKNNPKWADKNGNFPKLDSSNRNTAYGREARRVESQVIKTRVSQYKKSK